MKQQFFTHETKDIEIFVKHYAARLNPSVWVDPFAGEGHLLRMFKPGPTISIDIDPKLNPDVVADSFASLPPIKDCAVITNPPYAYRHILQKNNSTLHKLVRDAGYVDLYEYSIRRLIEQWGMIDIFAVLPENFIASNETKLRPELYKNIQAVQIHNFSTSHSTGQPTVMVYISPKEVCESDLWVGGERHGSVVIMPDGIRPNLKTVDNYVDFGMKDGQTEDARNTSILLQAIDGGGWDTRIKLMRVYEKFGDAQFHNKISDRAYIQIVPKIPMTELQINTLIKAFNKYVDKWRNKTNGLGLTSFRSNSVGGFRRKRLDFKLARLIINNLISVLMQRS